MGERKYAKDYRMEEYTDLNGKVKLKRVYQGENYLFTQSPEEIKRLAKTVLVVSAAVFAGLLPLLLTATQIGRTIYVLLPMAFVLVPLFQTAAVGYRLLRYQAPLTRQQRDLTDKRLKAVSIWLTALTGVTLCGSVVYMFLHGLEAGEIWCVLGIALGFGSSFALLGQRKKAQTVLAED